MQRLDLANPKPHHVVVVVDGSSARDFSLAKTVFVDGHELLVPSGAVVKVEVGDQAVMTATITIMASVEFRDVTDSLDDL